MKVLRSSRPGQRLPASSPSGPDLPAPRWLARLALHVALASIPVLAISADVFGWISLRAVTIAVLLPTLLVTIIVVVRDPDTLGPGAAGRLRLGAARVRGVRCLPASHHLPRSPVDRLLRRRRRLGDRGRSNYLVGYLWRYLGDGAGIGVVFFALAATLRAGSWSYPKVVGVAVGYAVCPVWAGLILTDLLAPACRQLFPLTLTTVSLSLAGHLVYGAVLGHGYWLSRRQEKHWPVTPATVRQFSALLAPSSRAARPAAAR